MCYWDRCGKIELKLRNHGGVFVCLYACLFSFRVFLLSDKLWSVKLWVAPPSQKNSQITDNIYVFFFFLLPFSLSLSTAIVSCRDSPGAVRRPASPLRFLGPEGDGFSLWGFILTPSWECGASPVLGEMERGWISLISAAVGSCLCNFVFSLLFPNKGVETCF